MKVYYLTLSQVFPVTHKRAGEPTGFIEKVLKSINEPWRSDIAPKVHTIRANYELWKKRFEEILAGEACLSVRIWTGKPYRSKQVEIIRLTKEDGIGLQKLRFTVDVNCSRVAIIDDICLPSLRVLANNDGLSLEDWNDWFRGYDCSKSMAIIQFTKYRY